MVCNDLIHVDLNIRRLEMFPSNFLPLPSPTPCKFWKILFTPSLPRKFPAVGTCIHGNVAVCYALYALILYAVQRASVCVWRFGFYNFSCLQIPNEMAAMSTLERVTSPAGENLSKSPHVYQNNKRWQFLCLMNVGCAVTPFNCLYELQYGRFHCNYQFQDLQDDVNTVVTYCLNAYLRNGVKLGTQDRLSAGRKDFSSFWYRPDRFSYPPSLPYSRCRVVEGSEREANHPLRYK